MLGSQGAHFSEVNSAFLPYPENFSFSVKLQSWATQAAYFFLCSGKIPLGYLKHSSFRELKQHCD